MPYTCAFTGYVCVASAAARGLLSRCLPQRRDGDGVRWVLAGGGRAPSATEARRRVDPGNARRRPVGWRRRRARARGGAALLALSPRLLTV